VVDRAIFSDRVCVIALLANLFNSIRPESSHAFYSILLDSVNARLTPKLLACIPYVAGGIGTG
jgi:hypothetical protein